MLLRAAVGKIDDCLIRRSDVLWQKEVGWYALFAVGGIEGDALLAPVGRRVVLAFEFGVELGAVVGIHALIHLEDRIGDRLEFAIVSFVERDGGGEILGNG